MSQSDYVIDNQTAPNFRADLNLALQALASTSSGATAPSTTYANMLWYDTATNTLKMRSEADDAWINLGTLDQSLNTFAPAGVAELTQVQAEDDTSTVFGQVSGQRLSEAGVVSFTDQEQQIGVGQVRVSGGRSLGTVYQNTTGRPIAVSVVTAGNNSSRSFRTSVDNVVWVTASTGHFNDSRHYHGTHIIPDLHYYKCDGGSIYSWSELA